MSIQTPYVSIDEERLHTLKFPSDIMRIAGMTNKDVTVMEQRERKHGNRIKWRWKMNTVSVLSDSHTFFVAQEITGLIRENKRARIEAIGAQAVSRAVKALALAEGRLGAEAISITCVPEQSSVVIEDTHITAIKIVVDPRSTSMPSA